MPGPGTADGRGVVLRGWRDASSGGDAVVSEEIKAFVSPCLLPLCASTHDGHRLGRWP